MRYEDSQDALESFFPAKMPIRSLEHIVGDLCDGVDGFYPEQARSEVCPDAVVTLATVGKKRVIIRTPRGGESFSQKASANPEKRGKKKMATVISTYVTPRHVRKTDDIVREMSDRESSDPKPKPQNKITWGSLTEGSENTPA